MTDPQQQRRLSFVGSVSGGAGGGEPLVGTLTVSELTELVSEAISEAFPRPVAVVGEVSNFYRAASGHLYFTLKDESSQIRCAMWRQRAAGLRFELQDGLAVVAEGTVEVYRERGQYQLYVSTLMPYGMGQLELAFRQLKARLEAQGLFDPAAKKPLPTYPLTIAVVTSAAGAAIRDILRTLQARWPVGRVLVYPVLVQGDEAAGQIAAAIEDLNRQADLLGGVDVMIVARGGGSLEDLWAFNEEVVARAIYASRIPVVSGVGHEIDVTISDLVADVRAATPTAAAQVVAPRLSQVLKDLRQLHGRLHRQVAQHLVWSRQQLEALVARPVFAAPMTRLLHFGQRVDDGASRLEGALSRRIATTRRVLHRAELQINRIRPEGLIHAFRRRVDALAGQLREALIRGLRLRRAQVDRLGWTVASHWPGGQLLAWRQRLAEASGLMRRSFQHRRRMNIAVLQSAERSLHRAMSVRMSHYQRELASIHHRLEGSSYRQVLKRGFSVTRRKATGEVLTAPCQIERGELIETQLTSGKVESVVSKTDP